VHSPHAGNALKDGILSAHAQPAVAHNSKAAAKTSKDFFNHITSFLRLIHCFS
jgi:hypothetical protein